MSGEERLRPRAVAVSDLEVELGTIKKVEREAYLWATSVSGKRATVDWVNEGRSCWRERLDCEDLQSARQVADCLGVPRLHEPATQILGPTNSQQKCQSAIYLER